MKKVFASLHARAICHATEELERVEETIRAVIGDADLHVSRTEGVHGNEIDVVQAEVDDGRAILAFFDRLSTESLRKVAETLEQRIDEERNMFIRIEKQLALAGDIRLSTGDDVVSVRLRVRSFPAKKEAAVRVVRQFLTELIAAREADEKARNG
ncbi:MAG: RNA-binding domain-containing protein [Thermoplasmata archaeon]